MAGDLLAVRKSLESSSEFEHHPERFEQGFERIEESLEEDSPPLTGEGDGWMEVVKEVNDEFVFTEILRNADVADDIIEKFGNKIDDQISERDLMERIRRGELLEELLSWENSQKLYDGRDLEVIEDSIFDVEEEASLVIGIDYMLRSEEKGKRLRPSLAYLTGYALFDEIDYSTGMIGAVLEAGKHAPSLVKDDEMDGDLKRRERISSLGFYRILKGEETSDYSTLMGDIMESWGRQSIELLSERDESGNIADERIILDEADEKLSLGQGRDIDAESMDLAQTDLEKYKKIIDQKTGVLFEAAVDPFVKKYIEQTDGRDGRRIRELFNRYIDRFNFLFQAGDDYNEIYEADEIGKSETDVENRKNQFVSIMARDAIEERHGEEYSKLFTDIFDGTYDQVTEEMREKASDLGVEIPGDPDEWETKWLTDIMRQNWIKDACNEYVKGYLEEANQAVEELKDMEVINEKMKQKYQELAEFVWTREY